MKRSAAVLAVAIAALISATIAYAIEPPVQLDATQPITLDEAITMNPTAERADLAAVEAEVEEEEAGGFVYCWYTTWGYQGGIYPYHQRIGLHTTWCGNGPRITYRSSWTSTDTFLCGAHDEYDHKLIGGAGYERVLVEGGAYFDCPTPLPWVVLHTHVWEQIWYDARGGTWAEAFS